MPSCQRCELCRRVVVFSRLFDETFQADTPAQLVALLIERQQREQAGDSAIALSKRVDAEEVEHERPDSHERRNIILVDGVAIDETKFTTAAGVASRRR